MIVRWLGHAAFSISHPAHPNARLCLDPHAPGVLGGRFRLPEIVGPYDAVLFTHRHEDHAAWRPALGTEHVIDRATAFGPYELRFRGVAHDTAGGARMGWVRMISVEDGQRRVVHVGDMGAFDAEDVAWLRGTDTLLVPVGGTYTLDGAEAADLVRAVKPRWAVPMHGADEAIDLPLAPTEDFVQALNWPAVALPQLDLSAPPPPQRTLLLHHPAGT